MADGLSEGCLRVPQGQMEQELSLWGFGQLMVSSLPEVTTFKYT